MVVIIVVFLFVCEFSTKRRVNLYSPKTQPEKPIRNFPFSIWCNSLGHQTLVDSINLIVPFLRMDFSEYKFTHLFVENSHKQTKHHHHHVQARKRRTIPRGRRARTETFQGSQARRRQREGLST